MSRNSVTSSIFSQGEGINLEGIRRILALEEQIDSLSGQVERLSDALQRLGETQEAARIFTAEPSGAVHYGRFRDEAPSGAAIPLMTTGPAPGFYLRPALPWPHPPSKVTVISN